MERSVSLPIGLAARVVTLALVAAVTGLAPLPAHAGLGSMVKSAKDKATQATGQKPAKGSPPKFDETTVELTGDMLDKLIACRKAANEVTKDRQKLVERSNQIQKELDDLQAKNHEAIIANTNKRGEVQNCRSVAFDELKQQKMMHIQERVQSNPQLIQRLSTVTAELSQAMAAGDTAKTSRLQQELDQIMGFTRADTLAIDKKCGQVPPVHPAQLRIDALNQEWNDIMARIRAMDEQTIQVEKDKCGMNEQQLGMAWDRIKKYLAGDQEFSDTERKALAERKDVLAPLAS
jgi:hypothetical protein